MHRMCVLYCQMYCMTSKTSKKRTISSPREDVDDNANARENERERMKEKEWK